jgi:hypothetical protein
MSTCGSNAGNLRRRIGWRAPVQMFADSAKSEPTKPSKPGFVGFVGAPHAEYAILRTPTGVPRGSSLLRPYRQSGSGGQPLQVELDFSTKTTRVMSWSESKAAEPEWRSGVVPAKAEA